MKKFVSIILIVLISTIFVSYASAGNSNDFTIVNGNLVKYSGNDNEIVIPYGVTYIADNAFEKCTAKKITIPDTVTKIGYEAFFMCKNLTSIKIPDSVNSIGDFAFAGCTTLKSITLPNSITSIGEGAFRECTALTGITIPENVTSIGYQAFYKCTALKNINITSSVLTYIGDMAFSECEALESIEIPYGITSINERTFFGCHALKSISIPDSVTSIKENAFGECSYLRKINLPESVTTIESMAFYSCDRLTEITLPGSLVSISPYAFKYCGRLKKIDVAESSPYFSSIGGVLFSKDKKELVIYPYGNYQESYTVPDGVTSINEGAFYNCPLVNVMLPDSITAIGDNAFLESTSLRKINFPNRLKTIGKNAFSQCFNLSGRVDLPNSVTSVGPSAFYLCNDITGVTISNRMTKLEKDVFYGCISLADITIPKGIKSIEEYALGLCSVLTSVRIPDSVTYISDYAFTRCSYLESIEIPKSVTSIGKGVFSDSPHLTIYTPKGSYAQSYAAQNGIKYSSGTFKAPDAVKKILIDSPLLRLCVGETANLNATVIPSTAKNKSVIWSSSNTKVAKVDKNGKVTAVGEGRAIISAKSPSNPNVEKTIAIFVLPSQTSSDSLPKLTNNISNGVRFTNLEKELSDYWKNLKSKYPEEVNVSPYYVSCQIGGDVVEATMLYDSIIIRCDESTPFDKLFFKNILKATVQNPQEVYDIYDKYFSGPKWMDNEDLVKYVGNVKCYMDRGFVCENIKPNHPFKEDENGVVTEGVRPFVFGKTDLANCKYLQEFMSKNFTADTYEINKGFSYSPFGKSFQYESVWCAIGDGYWQICISSFREEKERPILLALLKVLTADAEEVNKRFSEMWLNSDTLEEAIKKYDFYKWKTAGKTYYQFDTNNSGTEIYLLIKY